MEMQNTGLQDRPETSTPEGFAPSEPLGKRKARAALLRAGRPRLLDILAVALAFGFVALTLVPDRSSPTGAARPVLARAGG
jgi:hypothetical protein